MKSNKITIIGGGLAGCEAAWQLAIRNIKVKLFEMKPKKFSPAHKSDKLAELVCSNSLRSNQLQSAVGILKEEMRMAGSLIMEAADKNKVPAGKALAVDRQAFSSYITDKILSHPNIEVIREEVTFVPNEGITVIATGPLTSNALSESLKKIIGEDYLHFYDAIAPIVLAESINMNIAFRGSRYEQGDNREGDYINCPLTEEEYKRFITELLNAKKVPLKDFEKAVYFEGCLPIEVMAQRGLNTLRFGPMKPVGLIDPRTGKTPYAVVQLRMEDKEGTMYNMVGFQTKLTYPEQKRVFRLIPGLENAEFVRLGSIHRNTFVCAPKVIDNTLRLKKKSNIFLAGQISGVEGYVESTAMGLIVALNIWQILTGKKPLIPPNTTAHGALIFHISSANPKNFQPMNVNFGLFKPAEKKIPKKDRANFYAKRAIEDWSRYLHSLGILN